MNKMNAEERATCKHDSISYRDTNLWKCDECDTVFSPETQERIAELEGVLEAIWNDGRMQEILLAMIEKVIPNSRVIAMYKEDENVLQDDK